MQTVYGAVFQDSRLVVLFNDLSVRVWDTKSTSHHPQFTFSLKDKASRFNAFAFSDDGKELYFGTKLNNEVVEAWTFDGKQIAIEASPKKALFSNKSRTGR